MHCSLASNLAKFWIYRKLLKIKDYASFSITLKITSIWLFIHLSYKYWLSPMICKAVSEVLGKEPRTSRGGLKQTVTRVTLITTVIRVAKKKYKAPCPNEMGGGKEGWWRGERMFSWDKGIRAETGSVDLAKGKRREKAALGGNCKGCRLQVGRSLATAWARRGIRGTQRGHVGSSSSGENPTTMGSHGRKVLNRGVARSDVQEKAKTKWDFNTQDRGKTHRELEGRDPFILQMKTLSLKHEVTWPRAQREILARPPFSDPRSSVVVLFLCFYNSTLHPLIVNSKSQRSHSFTHKHRADFELEANNSSNHFSGNCHVPGNLLGVFHI